MVSGFLFFKIANVVLVGAKYYALASSITVISGEIPTRPG